MRQTGEEPVTSAHRLLVARFQMKPSKCVTEARAAAQRAKLDEQQAKGRRQAEQQAAKPKNAKKKREADPLSKRRGATTLTRAIEDYLNDHEGAITARKPCNGTPSPSAFCAVFWKQNARSLWLQRWTRPISVPGSPTCAKRRATMAN